MLDFVDITKDNVHLYCRFNRIFNEDLSNFQDSIYPRNSDFFVPLIEDGLLRWSYLFYNGKIIGAIWLEKEHSSLTAATLGIFISEKDKRSHGIGEQAIKEYISLHKKEMKLKEINIEVKKENIRAIKCYEKCNFFLEQKYEDTHGVTIINMTRSL